MASLARVIRLMISVLCALGLALAPAPARASAGPSTSAAACAMDGKMPTKPVNHAKTDCCTAACQPAAPAALMPARTGAAELETPQRRFGRGRQRRRLGRSPAQVSIPLLEPDLPDNPPG